MRRGKALVAMVGVCAGLLAAAGSRAEAAVELEGRTLRHFALPVGMDLSGVRVQGDGKGRTYLFGQLEAAQGQLCAVVVVDDDAGATQYDYRYQDLDTYCVGLVARPQGGFFLRGAAVSEAIMASENPVVGFTAAVDAQGQELWVVHDDALVSAGAYPDAGSGVFMGSYSQPLGVMAYSERFDRLLAFTEGLLTIGRDQKRVTQAHVLGGSSGRLRISGQTFGQSGVGSITWAEPRLSASSDGYFVLQFYSQGSGGSTFYTYNGDKNIAFLKPSGQDWSRRKVLATAHRAPDDAMVMLWVDDVAEASDVHLTVSSASGEALWSATWPGSEAANAALGLPVAMVAGDAHMALVYVTETAIISRWVETSTGRDLGLASLSAVTTLGPAAILKGSEGRVVLVAHDAATNQMHEIELAVRELPEEPAPEEPVDAPGPAEPASPQENTQDGGCAMAPSSRPSLPGWLVLAATWFGAGRLRGRRAPDGRAQGPRP